jgi:serine/threonine protein kinase
MPLSAGDKLGSYEILALIGKGGMGEVYRARDTRLKREVAVKVLPDAFAHDSQRMARFQRGQRFLMRKGGVPAGGQAAGLRVVVNWFEELRRLAPRK